jgi:hypothetical protein
VKTLGHSCDIIGILTVQRIPAIENMTAIQKVELHKLLLDLTATSVIETISNFALNARRAMELLPTNEKFCLAQPRWLWKPSDNGEIVNDLRDALNRIVDAKKLDVGFLGVPTKEFIIGGGALVIPYVKAETDRRSEAYIDPFALSHAFLYFAYPRLTVLSADHVNEAVH